MENNVNRLKVKLRMDQSGTMERVKERKQSGDPG
jgi:hypothetical protein